MPKQIVIAEQHRIAAVFAEDQIQELIVATGTHQVGDIYLGSVENVLPGIDAAFVNLGDSDRNGFMHVTDLGPLRLRRSAGSITELLAPQQKVLVQIMKEPTGNKGPRLTGNISLPGRYLVLMPYGRGVNLSRRIRSETERNRLRALAILVKPAGMGLLVRTEAEGVEEEAIIEDLDGLQRQWESVQQEATTARPPALLNRDDDFIQRVLRDVYSADVNRIAIDSHTGLKRVKQHLTTWNAGRMPQGVVVDHHRERSPILDYFRVNAAIREALKPRVDLPSGGYIVIEPTEALTVIDVNSGSFTRSATARETVLWTNHEAAEEIARQLRLRNLAGVIIVDFIDMESRRDKLQVLETFNRALRSDKARPQISQLSELGLVELTRKRQGQNIYELFGRTCPTCGGLGHLVHLPGEAGSDAPAPLEAVPSSRETGGGRPMAHPSLRESRGDALEPHEDLQDLELLNHPTFSDGSGRNNSNRRRRRREAPPLNRNGGRREGRNGASADGPVMRETSEEVAVVETVTPTPTPTVAEPVKVIPDPTPAPEQAIPSRSRTSRSSRSDRSERKPPTPKEVVVVEMTLEEQRIYASMGISPLVLSPQTVSDPQAVAISVVLPGQGNGAPRPLPALPVVTIPEVTVPEAVDSPGTAVAEPRVAPETEPEGTAPVTEAVPSPDATAVVEDLSASEGAAPGDAALENGSEEAGEEAGAVRRRRRRRPSAQAD